MNKTVRRVIFSLLIVAGLVIAIIVIGLSIVEHQIAKGPPRPTWIPSDANVLCYYNTRGWLDSGHVYITFTTSASNIERLIEQFTGEPTRWTTNILDAAALNTVAVVGHDLGVQGLQKPFPYHQYDVGHCHEWQGRYPWLVIIDTGSNQFWYIE